MTSRYEGCHGVKLGLDIVVGNFILLGYIGVRRRKESRCRGPCSIFLNISTMRLLGLSVCCDFPHGLIDTYAIFFLGPYHSAGNVIGFISLSLYNFHGGQGVTHTFLDEV